MHPRSRHQNRYDLKQLSKVSPELAPYVFTNQHGAETIDFAKPKAVKALNKAILMDSYGVEWWDIPEGYLCPPIPGRADYIHHIADLLEGASGKEVLGLDFGVGANCIYPLIGQFEYGWSFIGSDVDAVAVKSARAIIEKNKKTRIEIRHQQSPSFIFKGIIKDGEKIAFTMCNPPFHASAAEAAQGTQRKLRNLGLKKDVLNFGGKNNELWCPGGEKEFISKMIKESQLFAKNCKWFTTLVSKGENLPQLKNLLKQVKATDVRVIEMEQGQKKSRILAWQF